MTLIPCILVFILKKVTFSEFFTLYFEYLMVMVPLNNALDIRQQIYLLLLKSTEAFIGYFVRVPQVISDLHKLGEVLTGGVRLLYFSP
jgi:hypothetical protein